MLVAAVYLIIKLDELMTAVILMGFFSLLSSSIFMVMDAVDVAFTDFYTRSTCNSRAH